MPRSSLTMLRKYGSKIEAETIRIRLAAAGIRALVTGEDAGTALGLGGAATNRLVHLEVAEADYDRAFTLLEEDERRVSESGPWICGRCREQNEPGFDVCWSCNKLRSDDEQGRLDEEPPADPPFGFEPSIQIADDANPYRPPLIQRDSPARGMVHNQADALDESVARCFRAAIIGNLVFQPLMNLYGVYLLLRLPPDAHCRDARVRIAWCINLVSIPAWTLFWLAMFF